MLRVVRSIPRGRVATYGQIAFLAGRPQAARLVGRILSELPEGSRVPWHRVINARGEISRGPRRREDNGQRARLEAEGVCFLGARVDLDRHAWNPPLMA
jgi:methylated-DNA-protein-cysteine methyltransferase-like protein